MHSIQNLKANPSISVPSAEVHEIIMTSSGNTESFSSERKDVENFFKEFFELSPKSEEIIMESAGTDRIRVTTIHRGGPYFGATMKQYQLS